MERQIGRLERAFRPAVAVVAAALVLALACGTSPVALPSPALRTASITNPVPPVTVTPAGSDRALVISWTASTDAFVSGYRVYLDGVLKASPAGTSATVNGLVNGLAYSVTVITVTNFFGTTYVGTTASNPVLGTPRDSVAPAAPGGVSATRGDTRVTLVWVANAGDYDADGYRVLRDGAPLTGLLSGVGTTGYVDTAVVNDTTYTYTVQTHDTSGNWSVSSSPSVSATPTDLTAPAVPTGLVAVRGDEQVVLSWTANAEPDLAHYVVLRDGVQITTVTGATFTDTGLTNDTTYSYTLAAVDTHANRSPDSTPAVTATPIDLTPPAVPTGLAAVRGDGEVSLSWTANTEPDLAGYALLRDGVEIALVAGTSFPDTGLTNDTTYTYRLVALDSHGNRSAASPPVVSTPTDLTAPAVPTGLAAMRGDGQVSLSWDANPEPDLAGYRVFRDGVQVATVTGTGYVDGGLTNDTTYTYTLAAVDTHGNSSAESAPVDATPTDLTAPAAPAGLAVVPGDGQVDLSWTANGEPDLDGYRVLRDGVEIGTVTGTTYTDTGLTNDTTYAYTLVALDTHGNRSLESAPVDGTPTDLTAPAAPTGLVALAGDGQADLSWTANSEPDLDGYRVLRDGVEIATVTGTSYTDTGLTDGTTYSYTLVAIDTHGNRSVESAPADVTPVDVLAPAAPTGLAALAGDGQVDLSWTANGEPDLGSYVLLRDGVEIATVTATSYTDTGLTNDTTYTYTLVAVDIHANRSPESDPVDATPTDLTAPDAPTDLAADAGDGQVDLTWTANTEPDLAYYAVLRDGVEITTVTATTYTDTGLTDGTTYRYTVVAVDTHGNRSAGSAPVDATPVDLPPAAPTGATAAPGDGQALIRWSPAPEADVVGYRVLAQDGSTAASITAPATSATLSGLVNGTSYVFTVVAVDAAGNVSPASADIPVVPAPPPVPATGAGETGGLAASADGRFVVVGTRAQREAGDTNTAYELYLLDRTTGTSRRIAPLPAKTTGATDPTNTAAPAISDDGRYVALATTAQLIPADTNKLADAYRLDTVTGVWSLVSVPAGGKVSATVAGAMVHAAASVYAKSPPVALSGDGDLVLFYSARADLAPQDTNAAVDVFAKRMSTGVVTRVSTTATGTNLPRVATGPALALTPDGRYAVFPAAAGSGPVVLYRKTLSGAGAGAVDVVSSVTVSGRTTEFAVYRDAGDVAVSDDGSYVAFVTAAKVGTTTPTASWTTGAAYRMDTVTHVLTPLGSGQHTVWEHQVELDPTGRFAFFATAAPELAVDANGHTDHYRRDLDVPGPLVLVTAKTAGGPATGPAGSVAPTEYGRLFAQTGDQVLVTTSQAMSTTDANKLRDLYVKDLGSGWVGSPVG